MTEAVFLSTNREHRAECSKQFAIDTEPVPVEETHTSKGKVSIVIREAYLGAQSYA